MVQTCMPILITLLLQRRGRDTSPRSSGCLQAGVDVNAHWYCQNAVRESAGRPNEEVLRSLLDALSDVPVNSQLLSPAIRFGLPDNLQLLLDRGADSNFENCLPLQYAAGSVGASPFVVVAMVDMLIGAGANVHASDDEALRRAIREGTVVCVQRLLHHGASLRAISDDPQGATYETAARGEVPMIEVLLDAGMPLKSRAASEILDAAAQRNHIALIELFEGRGASPVATDSARLVAAVGQRDLPLVHESLKRQLDPLVLHGEALKASMDVMYEPVVAALLEQRRRAGPAPPETLGVQQDCLRWAASYDSIGIFRLLVDHVTFDANDLTAVLHALSARHVCEAAVGPLCGHTTLRG